MRICVNIPSSILVLRTAPTSTASTSTASTTTAFRTPLLTTSTASSTTAAATTTVATTMTSAPPATQLLLARYCSVVPTFKLHRFEMFTDALIVATESARSVLAESLFKGRAYKRSFDQFQRDATARAASLLPSEWSFPPTSTQPRIAAVSQV